VGNIVATGVITTTFQQTVNIGGLNRSYWYGGVNPFLVKFASGDGHALWIAHLTANSSTATAPQMWVSSDDTIVLADYSGFVYVGGSDDFGTGSTHYNSAFLSKWSSSGVLLLSRAIGPGTQTIPYGIVTDSSGSIIMTGRFQNNTDLGNGAISGGAAGGDGYLAKYSGSDLSCSWAFPVKSSQQMQFNAVAVDSQSNIAVIGNFYKDGMFYDVSGTIKQTITATTGSTPNPLDVCVAKYSKDGVLSWAHNYGGPGDDYGNGGAMDSSGSPIVTGELSLAGLDCFLMKLNP
jgi:hypothetical protein